MGTGTLTDRASGQTILDTFWNDIHDAMNGDFVGRNSSGIATTGQNLGTNAIPWGVLYTDAIVLDGSAVDTSLLTAPKNRVVSGKKRSASNQPQFIDPNGAAASFVLEGATTNLVVDINGTAVTATTDITKSSLTVGPSTTATCLVDEALAADQASTRTWGERGAEKEEITVDNMGAEFQAFIGQYVIVKIAGTSDEYALVYVKSTTKLSNCYRGFFFNSSGAPIQRAAFTNNGTITVLSTGWVFIENNATTVDVTYKTPVKTYVAPTSPATGDYWYDIPNETWKRYDGASWAIINRTLIGVVGIDSANCVCARSFDFYEKCSEENTINLEINSTEIILGKSRESRASVYGNLIQFGFNVPAWNITTMLAGAADIYNATEQASTIYFLYLKDTAETVISDVEPQYRAELSGWYNPHNPWRCIGEIYNDGSSNITMVDNLDFNPNINERVAYVKDVKATGTAAGTFTSGAWQTRVFNTVEENTAMLSLASNVLRMTTGKYILDAKAPAKDCDSTALRIRDTAGSVNIALGATNRTGGASDIRSQATAMGAFYARPEKTVEVQHRCQTTRATDGFGAANSFGENEVYATMKITKVKRIG